MFTRLLTALLLAAAAPPMARAQNCQPYWTGLGVSFSARSLVVFDDGSGPRLYASGVLPNPSYLQYGVARWDGRNWEVLNGSLPPLTNLGYLFILHDGQIARLYVWLATGGSNVGQLWTWAGSGWQIDPVGFSPDQNTGPRISFQGATGWETFGIRRVSANHDVVLQWIDNEWVQRGGVFSSLLTAFASYDDGTGPKLYVGGYFTAVGTVPANRMARWDGTSWSALGSGIDRGPRTMIVHNDGSGAALYVADVLQAGGQPVNRIAKWNGQAWSDVGGGGIMSVGITTLHILGSFDDGTGPALFAGGYMQMAGGNVPVRSIARYKGGVWDDMLGGVRGGIPRAMAVYDDGRGPSLFVGGEFGTVGAGPWPVPPGQGSALGIAQWVGCHNQCYADCDNSRVAPRLNVEDFSCFIQKFAYGNPYVDCNQDGIRDVQDFHCFIERFMENCR
jgi:hypothetical protein